jgi:hypothetical protein
MRRICHNIISLTSISNYPIGGRVTIGNPRFNLYIHIRFWDGRVKVCLLTHWRGKPMRDGIN